MTDARRLPAPSDDGRARDVEALMLEVAHGDTDAADIRTFARRCDPVFAGWNAPAQCRSQCPLNDREKHSLFLIKLLSAELVCDARASATNPMTVENISAAPDYRVGRAELAQENFAPFGISISAAAQFVPEQIFKT